jgi:hypothetical protein
MADKKYFEEFASTPPLPFIYHQGSQQFRIALLVNVSRRGKKLCTD